MHEQLSPVSKRALVCRVGESCTGKCAKVGYTFILEIVCAVLTISSFLACVSSHCRSITCHSASSLDSMMKLVLPLSFLNGYSGSVSELFLSTSVGILSDCTRFIKSSLGLSVISRFGPLVSLVKLNCTDF